MRGTLAVLTRHPEAGRTKTRLIPALGAQGAAELHRRLGRHTLDIARRAAAAEHLVLQVHHTGPVRELRAWLGDDLDLRPQGPGDLGARMTRIVEAAELPLVIVGTDCPGLDAATIANAFAALDRHDLVLGPALDGGYYLVGMRGRTSTVFERIDWGTARVLDQTLARAAELAVELLPAMADVDRPEDLAHLPPTLLPPAGD